MSASRPPGAGGPEPGGTGRPDGIPGSALAGPFAVGEYAARLRDRVRAFTRVQIHGEVFNLGRSAKRVYFELRDGDGAIQCAMWRDDFDRLGLPEGAVADGSHVVVAGGPDYYAGSRTASPGFSFHVTALRLAGEGDLLAQLARLRRTLDAEGLFRPQKALPRPLLPRTIGVVTGERGKARDDVLAGLRRRGWAGRLVWGFAPVQDRRAAPAIATALQDLAACPEVEVVIVARGGGSLADLFCFCDETLCRTVALLRVPVIASVGHHTDRTLIDDVAAVSCSTPTHAAEAAVGLDVLAARAELRGHAGALARGGRAATVGRARHLAALARAPGRHLARQRAGLHQSLREMRAAGRRRIEAERDLLDTWLLVHRRKAAAAAAARGRAAATLPAAGRRVGLTAETALVRRRRDVDRLAQILDAHDPQRTLERGYARVEDPDGSPLVSAAAARGHERFAVRFADGRVPVVREEGDGTS